LLTALASLLFAPAIPAKETKAEAALSEEPDIVIVPYDPKTPPAEQNPDQLYLPYDRFLKLWQAAKEHQRPPAEQKPAPLPYGLTSARYDAKLEQRGILVTGVLDLFTGHAWVKVPLPFARTKVSGLTIDGQAAVWENDELLVEKQGRHQVTVAFELPRVLGAVDFSWGIPRSSATMLVLTIPQPETTATIEPGSGAVEQLTGGARVVTAALGSAGEIRVHLRTAEKPATAGAPVAATIHETARLSAIWEEFQADAEFSFPSSVQDKFTILFEKGLTLTDLSAPNLKSWTLRPEGAGQALDVELYEPAKETFTVHVATQRFPAAKAVTGTIPLFSTTARRTELASLAVFAAERATATLTPAGGLRQIPARTQPPDGWRVAGAFAGAGTLQYQLSVKTPRREAKVEYLYQVGRRQLELFASMELLAAGDPLESLQIELPPGFDVETLQSTRPHTWWRTATGNLVIAFENATPPSTKMVLHLVQKAPPAAALEIRSLKFVDFHKVESEVVIAARKGVDTALTLPALATDLKPEEAVPSFDVVAPLERERAFRSATGDFAGQVQLTSRTPRAEAVWALRVEAHEAWLGLSYAVRLNLKQGSLDSARFTLPAGLAEARVAGSEVREARSKVEGDVRTYDVSFQNEVTDAVEFTVDLEIPHAGEVALPSLLFPGTAHASGFLLIENASEGEMRLATAGLDKATVAELPWQVPNAQRAELYRVPPADWSAKVTVERLEKAAGRLAFCPWAEFSTAFRRDGTEWHKAVWHLQNRALQFLPVRLPIGAELVSVRVAGQSMRADSGQVEGGPALLIPLIKTRPGELSYDVEAVFRIAQPALKGSTKRTLEDPDLLGITVERTFWNIWAPAGFEIVPARGGNMDQIIGDVAVADKLDDTLQELKRLNGIMNLSGAGSETHQIAAENFRRLQQTIEIGNNDLAQQQQLQPGQAQIPTPAQQREAGSKGNAQQQFNYVRNKLAEVNRELEKEVRDQRKQVEGADIVSADAPMVNAGVPAPALPNTPTNPSPESSQAAMSQESLAALGMISVKERFAGQGGQTKTEAQPVQQGVRNNWKLNPTMNNGTLQTGKDGQTNLALNDNVQYNGNVSTKAGAVKRERLYNSVDELTFDSDRKGVEQGQNSLSAARAINNVSNGLIVNAGPDITASQNGPQAAGQLTGNVTFGAGVSTLNPQRPQPAATPPGQTRDLQNLNYFNKVEVYPRQPMATATPMSRVSAGTITLNGNNTYTGRTTLNEGTLTLNGGQTQTTVNVGTADPNRPEVSAITSARPSSQPMPTTVTGTGRVVASGGTSGTTPALTPSDYPFVNPNGSPVGTQPVTSGLRNGNLAISQNAIDALLFGVAGTSAINPPVGTVSGVITDPHFMKRLSDGSLVDLNGVAGTPDGGFNNKSDVGRAAPRPTPIDRRITLAVDFPTEGEPIHFKKLKGAATVRVELTPQETIARGRNAFLLAIAAGMLFWVRRRFGSRATV
jgi:autotransporter-associated beta strand protein